jgi:hypothetical protein
MTLDRGEMLVEPLRGRAARMMLDEILAEIETLTARIQRSEEQIAADAKEDEDIRRLTASARALPGYFKSTRRRFAGGIQSGNQAESVGHERRGRALLPTRLPNSLPQPVP